MLIDKNGMIAFKGHPANREDLEQDLDDLAAGNEITGKGTKEDNIARKEEEKGDGNGKEMSRELINKEVDDFVEKMEKLQKDEEL
jgi:hypothetical protein